MDKPGTTFLSVAALLALWAVAPPPAQARDATLVLVAGSTPGEVRAFIRRKAGCNRLSSEDADDPDRVAETVKTRLWMKCATLPDEERRLRARYADQPGALDALNQGDDLDNNDD